MPKKQPVRSTLLTLTPEQLELDASLPSPVEAYLNTLSPSGRRTQAAALNNLAFLFSDGKIEECLKFPWHLLRYEHTSGLAVSMVGIGYAKSSVNKHLVALRRVLEEAYRLGQFDNHDDFYRAAGIRSLRTQTIPRGRALKMSELEALVSACLAQSNNPNLGLRRGNYLHALRGCPAAAGDCRPEPGRPFDQRSSPAHPRQGQQKRAVFLSQDAMGALLAWLELRGANWAAVHTRHQGGKSPCGA